MMTVKKIMNGSELTAGIEGRIDTLTAPELEKQLLDGIDSVESLLIDFSDVAYISSAGFRALLAIKKAMLRNNNDKMKIVNVSTLIHEIFEETGFIDIFDIERIKEAD